MTLHMKNLFLAVALGATGLLHAPTPVSAQSISKSLLERWKKSVLDCLEYPSKSNCDKAQGSYETLRPAISQLPKKCGLSVGRLAGEMIVYSFGATHLGNTPQVRKDRSEIVNNLLKLDEACKK